MANVYPFAPLADANGDIAMAAARSYNPPFHAKPATALAETPWRASCSISTWFSVIFKLLPLAGLNLWRRNRQRTLLTMLAVMAATIVLLSFGLPAPVMAAGLAVAVAVGLAAGILPAIRATHSTVLDGLHRVA